MQSHKVMRQMPERSGRAGRRHGEAGSDTASDDTRGTLHEHPATGSAKQLAGTGGLLEAALRRQNLCQGCHDLKLSNRPVRTRMPGGVAGAPPIMEAPYADPDEACT
jgi:hypothetical protein